MLNGWIRLGMLVLAVAVFSAVCVPSAARADKDEKEREVTLDQVPAEVKATILKAAGKNKVEEIEEVVVKLYEAEWTRGDREIEVLVAACGKLVAKEIEEDDDEKGKKGKKDDDEDDEEEEEDEKEVTLDQLPDKAKATILKLAGKSKVEEVEEVTMKLYEAEWIQGRREVEILVAPCGKLLGREVEKADDEDDDDDDDDGDQDHKHKHKGKDKDD